MAANTKQINKNTFVMKKTSIRYCVYFVKRLCKIIYNYFHYAITKFSVKMPKVEGLDETLDIIVKEHISMSRFGDGELNLLSGMGGYCGYQDKDAQLAARLIDVLKSTHPKLIVCLPESFTSLRNMELKSQFMWMALFRESLSEWMKYIPHNNVYYNTFATRFYMAFSHDYGTATSRFEKLKSLWHNRDILIIEGELTRMGVGNDLFNGAKSTLRIICPATNAFSAYDTILQTAKKHGNNRLVLIALGATATVLAHDLALDGYWAIDLGHLDLEYEWYIRKTKKKINLNHKWVNEVPNGRGAESISDPVYLKSVVQRIGVDEIAAGDQC